MPPPLLTDTTDWKKRAREAPQSAAQTADPATKAWLIGLAAECRRLAKLSAGRRAANRDVDRAEP